MATSDAEASWHLPNRPGGSLYLPNASLRSAPAIRLGGGQCPCFLIDCQGISISRHKRGGDMHTHNIIVSRGMEAVCCSAAIAGGSGIVSRQLHPPGSPFRPFV